ncbi:VCBS repeat-containing protein [bacterium]|nr:VCBS repeat-containing protein [bacterium]
MWRWFSIFLIMGLLVCGCSDDDSDSDATNDIPDDPALTSIPFSTLPDWESQDVQSVSTGLAAVDLNNDSWPDLVVANGNDIHRQRLVVYYNQGDGVFPTIPDWEANDSDYHGHLAAGDINGDGFSDVVVSVYLGPSGFQEPGYVKMYMNNGGILEGSPSWRSTESFYTFSLDLGDLDNDGDLDLAVATGEEYYSHSDKNRIFLNQDGLLSPTSGWASDGTDYAYDITWADLNNDGYLELVLVESGGTAAVHYNNKGVLETTPSWRNTDALLEGNSLTLGDLNNDGFLDLALSDNYQLVGSGVFRVYLNNQGSLDTAANWISADQGYSSGISLADLNRDGWLELITGTWGENDQIGTGHVRVYTNNQDLFNTHSDWCSETRSVIEAITFADLDRDGLIQTTETKTVGPDQSLFYLEHIPIETITQVSINGQVLTTKHYCFNREQGWLSLNRNLLSTTTSCTIDYSYSKRPDLIVSNWDSNKGNYIFFNTSDK